MGLLLTSITKGPRVDKNDDHRSLKRIAARLIATKELEEEALDELDKIARGIDKRIGLWSTIAATGFCFFILLAIVSLAAWLTATAYQSNVGVGLLYLMIAFAVLGSGFPIAWRFYQYPFGRFGKMRPPIYPVGNCATVETLEKLFAYVSRRTSPALYYRTKKGDKRNVSRGYMKNRLRGLLIADLAADRAQALPPSGLCFFREIKVEADPEEIIATLKARPRSNGRPPRYNYEAIVLTLIGHPKLPTIEIGQHGSEAAVMQLIREECDASDTNATEIPVPEPTELRKLAKRVLAALEKNRTRKK
jgi:hypothetical protein